MPFLKRGKKSRAWDAARRKLKTIFERKGITRCEVCGAAYPLGFAHRTKRRHIADDSELMTVALLCNLCHEKAEFGGNMFAEIDAIIQRRTA